MQIDIVYCICAKLYVKRYNYTIVIQLENLQVPKYECENKNSQTHKSGTISFLSTLTPNTKHLASNLQHPA